MRAKKTKLKFNVSKKRQEDGLYLGDNIDILKELYWKKSEKAFGKHPTQKPLDLRNRIIKASTNEGDIVLDPFLGSGTTTVSCILNNRKYIGIEKEKEYFELAKKRVEDAEKKVKNWLF